MIPLSIYVCVCVFFLFIIVVFIPFYVLLCFFSFFPFQAALGTLGEKGVAVLDSDAIDAVASSHTEQALASLSVASFLARQEEIYDVVCALVKIAIKPIKLFRFLCLFIYLFIYWNCLGFVLEQTLLLREFPTIDCN